MRCLETIPSLDHLKKRHLGSIHLRRLDPCETLFPMRGLFPNRSGIGRMLGIVLLVSTLAFDGLAEEPTPARSEGGDFAPYFEGTAAFEAFRSKRWSEAARLFHQWKRTHPRSPLRPWAEWMRSVSLLYAGEAAKAGEGLEALLDTSGLLKDYGRLLAAQARFRQGLGGRTLRHLDAIQNPNFAQGRMVSLLRMRALVQLERHDKAARQARKHVNDYPTGGASVLFEIIGALERGPGERAQERGRILRSIIARFPHTVSARKADRMLGDLPRALKRFTLDELAIRLDAQYKGQWHGRALQTVEAIQKRSRRGSGPWCAAGYRKARIHEKQRAYGRALTAFAALVPRCNRTPSGVNILYYGGKRRMSQNNVSGALAWFRTMRTIAPKHSYVDDTYRWEAKLLRKQGKHRRADKLFKKVVAFEGGDMAEDAAWDLVWYYYLENDLSKAAQLAEKMVQAVGWEKKSYTSGRLRYWQGRIEQLRGQRVRAALAYASCIRAYPLSYYGLLATQRLAAMDAEAMRRALAETQQVPSTSTVLGGNQHRQQEPGFRRAVTLLRLGFTRFASAELSAGGFALGTDAEGDWLLALLYNRVGDFTRSVRASRLHPGFARYIPRGNHRERWELAYPRPPPYHDWVRRAARQHHVPEGLVWAVMRTESHFRTTALSRASAVGLMQLIVPTAKSLARQEGVTGTVDRDRLQDPDLNIRLGTRFLGKLSRRFDGHTALIAAGYNAGPGGPTKWLRQWPNAELDEFVERIPYRETRRYAKVVVTASIRYRHLAGEESLPNVAFRLPNVE
jgi:soluble lytic murein transglycosylase